MKQPNSVHVYGNEGRIGQSATTRLQRAGYDLADEPTSAEIVFICTPSKVAQMLLENLRQTGQLVIDFSGAAKRSLLGSYGLLNKSNELWSSPPLDEAVFGNPGCIASAVLRGLDDSGLREDLAGEIQVTACGGKSYAHKSAAGSALRSGNRTIEHPHVQEVERALSHEQVSVTHFSTVISSDIEHGLLVNVSGALSPSSILRNGGNQTISIDQVIGTDEITHRYQTYEKNDNNYFTLQVAIDNIEFVTSNAVRLLTTVQTAK